MGTTEHLLLAGIQTRDPVYNPPGWSKPLRRVYPPIFQGDIATQQNYRIHLWVNPVHSAKADKKARQYKRACRGTKGIYW